MVAQDQLLPDMKDFWGKLENKVSMQSFFLKYCQENYQSSKPLYIAGGLPNDPTLCTMIVNGQTRLANDFNASHEEADDRLMFSINQVFQRSSSRTVTVVTGYFRY